MPDESRGQEAHAALDAAQQQLKAAASATLEEHLRSIAQRRIDEELAALSESGAWSVDPSVSYEVVVRRTSPV
jgi:hypothetical protein